MCLLTGTLLGPGLFPGPLYLGLEGVDLLCSSTRTVFGFAIIVTSFFYTLLFLLFAGISYLLSRGGQGSPP